jgi:NAD(P)-dependent dehydrogenase (short-subunit alcohol dehydrogenase family)
MGKEAGEASVLLVPADISRVADVAALVSATTGRWGRLDGVANVAGVSFLPDGRIEDVSEEVFDRTIAVNLRGTFLMCKHAIPALRASGGGAIVNVGSVASVRGVRRSLRVEQGRDRRAQPGDRGSVRD